MGIILTLGYYLVTAVFLGTYVAKALTWRKSNPAMEPPPAGKKTPKTIVMFLGDVVFLTRLFRVNPGLWIGEWIFHVSVVLVIIRHLRYVINPIPLWLWAMQTPGMIAGWILPLSLLYIFINKLIAEKRRYVSSYNFFLLFLLLLLSISGLFMQLAFRTDVVGVKIFMMGIFTFMPATAPDALLFVFHFGIALLFLAFLPTHAFAAPLVIFEARLREEGLQEVLHEE